MEQLNTASSGGYDQVNAAELAASVKQMSEYLSRDCAAAGLGFLAHLLAMAAAEAQDVMEDVDPNWSRSTDDTMPVSRLG